ncbi:hypothetical protein EDD15DRAFT_2195864 [Pisolithus albus]|nr:hypothetical protein EDD15DRAFT_2195864 [Pisolithus albus]
MYVTTDLGSAIRFPWGPYAAQSSHGALVPRKVNVAGAGIAASSLSGYLLAVLEATYSLGVHVPRKVNAAGASSAASFLRGSALAALRATCNTTLTHLLPKVGVPGGGLLWSSLRGCSSLALGPIHICIISAINLPRNPCAVQSQRSWSWQLDAACMAELPHGFGSADLMAMVGVEAQLQWEGISAYWSARMVT